MQISNRIYPKHEARAENHDHSHCYASCDPKTEKQKYQPIAHKSCGYNSSRVLTPNDVCWQVALFQLVKHSLFSPFYRCFSPFGQVGPDSNRTYFMVEMDSYTLQQICISSFIIIAIQLIFQILTVYSLDSKNLKNYKNTIKK